MEVAHNLVVSRTIERTTLVGADRKKSLEAAFLWLGYQNLFAANRECLAALYRNSTGLTDGVSFCRVGSDRT